MLGAISVNYKLGGRGILPKSWQGKNLVLPYHKFYFVEEGEILVETDERQYIVGAGELLLIPAKLPHSCFLTEKGYAKKAWCHFELLQGGEQFFNRFDMPLKIRVQNKAEVLELFNGCFSQSLLRQNAAVLALTDYYLLTSNAKTKGAGLDGTEKAVAFLKEHYDEEFSLARLAKHANYSPNHLIRRFKEKTGLTPVSYLHALRVEEAKRLLKETNDSVGEIMERVGFLDAAYFSKTFKRLVGYSPKRYRDMERK